MYVEDVQDGVCHFYKTLYTEYRSDVKDVKDTLNPPSVLDLSLTSPTCFKLVEYYGSYEQEWVCMFFSHLGHLQHTIALQPLGVFDLSSTSSTCFNIHSIGWYG